MPSLTYVLIVLAMLCCHWQVNYANPKISASYFEYPNRTIVIGKNHFDKTTLVYALCARPVGRITKCRIMLDTDSFNDSESIYFCDVNLMSEAENGELDIFEINLWGKTKALLSWRDSDDQYLTSSMVKILKLDLPSCKIAVLSVNVDNNRIHKKPEIFIDVTENRYTVVYADSKLCNEDFCKMIVDDEDRVSTVVKWFPSDFVVHGLERIGHNSDKTLLIAGMDEIWAKYYLLNDNNQQMIELGGSINRHHLGWSTSNGFISFCNMQKCSTFDHNGQLLRTKGIIMRSLPTDYIALYTLSTTEHLAVICDSRVRSNYRFILIGPTGDVDYFFNIPELKCARKPKYLISKIFKKGETEYCLAIFHSHYIQDEKFKFTTFCWTFPILLLESLNH